MTPAPPGAWNRRLGWASIAAGVGSGLVLGLWSFDGPVPAPAWLGDYGSVSRRLVRLGHIAFVGLGILDLLLARELPRLALGPQARRLCSNAMILGNALLPPVLLLAGAWPPAKYALPLPASAAFAALALAAWGAWKATDDAA